ncbi:DUF805 domain-containing protein [Pseudoduganella eburnea]|uniref:DUF805 domain-containing protein n=1 Tax=Massilia eburnea TaxID=1776165 RepID=A0A6L6QN18_9BURK|nr:DUF805 domain-containing protein [Massilia eburnea]
MTNPYSMPQAELTETVGDETYEPKFFALDGRIGRVRYWAYSIGWGLLILPVIILTTGLGALTGSFSNSAGAGGLIGMGISYLLSTAIGILLARRRLADLGQTRWLAALMAVPYLNGLFGLYLLFAPGDVDSNEYGPAPEANSTGVKLLAWIPAVLFILGIVAAIAIPAYSGYAAKARAAQMSNGQ